MVVYLLSIRLKLSVFEHRLGTIDPGIIKHPFLSAKYYKEYGSEKNNFQPQFTINYVLHKIPMISLGVETVEVSNE